ncbi:MAG: translational GTPase TypA, partial [Pseudomonadales bacterium]|nr:translational GTPase TypA [Pseudomonadales bacterium]
LGRRRATIVDMVPDSLGRVRLEYLVPTRALLGFLSEFLTLTSGTGLMNSVFSHYGPVTRDDMASRNNGVLISMTNGKSVAFALNNLQARGRLFIGPNEEIYEGMIVGLHVRGNDLTVNPLKEKQLSNIRAAGNDENVMLTPPVRHSLESAIEFIDDDELVEITPESIRIRKKLLTENERKRASRARVA